MASSSDLPAPAIPETANPPSESRTWRLLRNPVAVFLLVSSFFGLAALVLNPPLRGPDEPAHFLRSYGISRGEIVPATVDQQGRKGILLPARLREEFRFFEDKRHQAWDPGFTYRGAFGDYVQRREARTKQPDDGRPPVFELYEGSESYSPASYVPYVAAAFLGRTLDLDFLKLFYLMRLAGFLATTALAAYAIAVSPHLKWTFLFIAMLPSALYARAVISIDGMALSLTLLVVALSLRAAARFDRGGAFGRAFWMTLCVLAKPSQIALVVLEAMTRPFKELPRRWLTVGLIVLPGLVLTGLWILAIAGDAGTWRVIAAAKRAAEDFDPVRKLVFLMQEPLRFPTIILATLAHEGYEHWRQLIGVLGWLDTLLQAWVYPVMTVLLCASFVAPLPFERNLRRRIAAVAALGAVGYFLTVYLIFYLSWTPIDMDEVWGIQGRYFVVALPLVALVVAALLNVGPGRTIAMPVAVTGAILSGFATIEAILRANWG